MKRILLTLVALSIALPTSAQTCNDNPLGLVNGKAMYAFACEKCGVEGWLDYPRSGATLTVGSVLHGWGLETFTGNAVTRIDVFYEANDDCLWRPLLQPEWALQTGYARPDVWQWASDFGALAPSPVAGWHLTLVNLPPGGARRLRLNLWAGPYMRWIVRTFNVVQP